MAQSNYDAAKALYTEIERRVKRLNEDLSSGHASEGMLDEKVEIAALRERLREAIDACA